MLRPMSSATADESQACCVGRHCQRCWLRNSEITYLDTLRRADRDAVWHRLQKRLSITSPGGGFRDACDDMDA